MKRKKSKAVQKAAHFVTRAEAQEICASATAAICDINDQLQKVRLCLIATLLIFIGLLLSFDTKVRA